MAAAAERPTCSPQDHTKASQNGERCLRRTDARDNAARSRPVPVELSLRCAPGTQCVWFPQADQSITRA
jgi:hypothetical protein